MKIVFIICLIFTTNTLLAQADNTNLQRLDIHPKTKNIIALCPLAIVPGMLNESYISKAKIKFEHSLNKNKSIGIFLVYGFTPLSPKHKYYLSPSYYQGIGYSFFGRQYLYESLNDFYCQIRIFGYTPINNTDYNVNPNQNENNINYYGFGGSFGYQLTQKRFSIDIGVGLKITTLPRILYERSESQPFPIFGWYINGQGSIFDGTVSIGYSF